MHSNKHKNNVLIYENSTINVYKIDHLNYMVKAKNGSYGLITCDEPSDELIVVIKKNKYETIGRFIHYKENSDQDFESFVIEQSVNNIIYLVSKTHLHSIHKDFTPFMNNVTVDEDYKERFIEHFLESFDFNGTSKHKVIKEEHNHSEKNYVYYYVLFVKKKIINDVFRYTKIFKNKDMKTLKKIHFYKISDLTLSFGSFSEFVDNKKYNVDSTFYNRHLANRDNDKKSEIAAKVNSISLFCDINSIKVLKYKKYYVDITFEDGKHKIVYMENLSRDEYKRKKYNCAAALVDQNEYIQESYLTIKGSIQNNKLALETSFDIDEIKNFDDNIVTKIFKKKKNLALSHPSCNLKTMVLNLGFDIDNINLDVLETIDMYTY